MTSFGFGSNPIAGVPRGFSSFHSTPVFVPHSPDFIGYEDRAPERVRQYNPYSKVIFSDAKMARVKRNKEKRERERRTCEYFFKDTCMDGDIEEIQLFISKCIYEIDRNMIIHIYPELARYGKIEVIKWLYSQYPSDPEMEDRTIYENYTSKSFSLYDMRTEAVKYVQLEVLQWLYTENSESIYLICEEFEELSSDEANLPVLQWFYSIESDYQYESEKMIHRELPNLFTRMCRDGKVEFAKWIYSLLPDVLDEHHFIAACENRRHSIVEWIHSLFPEQFQYTVNESGDIIPGTLLLSEKRVSEITQCVICYEDTSDVITSCNHQYCTTCIKEWMKRKRCCAYCRKSLMFHIDLFKIVRE